MNIGGLERRVTNLEKASRVGRDKPIRICFQEHWQTKAQAMQTAGIAPDDDSITVFIVKWVDKPPRLLAKACHAEPETIVYRVVVSQIYVRRGSEVWVKGHAE